MSTLSAFNKLLSIILNGNVPLKLITECNEEWDVINCRQVCTEHCNGVTVNQ